MSQNRTDEKGILCLFIERSGSHSYVKFTLSRFVTASLRSSGLTGG